MNDQGKYVVIEYFSNLDSKVLEPAVSAFQQAGVPLRLKPDEVGRMGSMGPLADLSTAVAIFIGTELGKALLGEIAKDAYSAVKRGFAALWKNIEHDPGYSSKYSMKLSAIWEFQNGCRLKLLLDPSSQANDAETAFVQFLELVQAKLEDPDLQGAVEEDGPDERIGAPAEDDKLEIVVFNPESNTLEPVDPWESE